MQVVLTGAVHVAGRSWLIQTATGTNAANTNTNTDHEHEHDRFSRLKLVENDGGASSTTTRTADAKDATARPHYRGLPAGSQCVKRQHYVDVDVGGVNIGANRTSVNR